MTLHYTFPKITNIKDILPAIVGRDEFKVIDKGEYTVINYFAQVKDTFSGLDTVNTVQEKTNLALRRECRGIIFNSKTGEIIRRPFQKFFNAGEREDMLLPSIDVSRTHWILEKLDGSMIVPFSMEKGIDVCVENLRWGTKMGETDVAKLVHPFLEKHPQYARYAAHCLASGWNLIFEFCSRSQRIVIDYPEDRLVLTAARHLTSGEYLTYDKLKIAETHGIEVVQMFPGTIDNMQQFVDDTRNIKDQEGYVIRFDNGHMIKIKGEQYCTLHRAKESLSQEKDVWRVILEEKMDDLLATCQDSDRQRLENMRDLLNTRIMLVSSGLVETVRKFRNEIMNLEQLKMFDASALKNVTKKILAVDYVNNPKYLINNSQKGLIFKIWERDLDDNASYELVRDYILDHTSTNARLELARELLGKDIIWEETQVNES